MRKFLLALLIVVLTLTLSVNYVRFLTFESSNHANEEFVEIDVFNVLDIVSQLDVSTDNLFADLLDTVEKLGSAGQKFTSAFNSTVTITGTFFDKILSFFSSLVNGVVGLIEFIASVMQSSLSAFIWVFDTLVVVYKLLNALLGTTFGM